MTALHGERPDKIPFTAYTNFLPPRSSRATRPTDLPADTPERELLTRGLCLVERTASYRTLHPHVAYHEEAYTDDQGRKLLRGTYATPYGELSRVWEPVGFTTWRHEWLFKSPDDYRALLFLIQDTVVEEQYDAVAGLEERLGENYVVRDQLPLEPLQNLISSHYMSMETFCVEWMERRDEVLKLYQAFAEVARRIYPIVAKGPLAFCNYGGNVVPSVIGPQVFRDYYLPHYQEAAEALHRGGKLIGSHLDADNTPIMNLVPESGLDYIEAYDPGISPSVAEARAAWPDQVLWINYPSAWHLLPVEEVYAGTRRMIQEASPGNGFLIGITEDLPEDRWVENYRAILDAIDEG